MTVIENRTGVSRPPAGSRVVSGRTVSDPAMLPPDLGPVAVAIGQFDGVHRGHQQLVAHARRSALRDGIACGVVTFADHPTSLLAPGRTPRLLTGHGDRFALLERCGVDFVLALPLSAELLGTSAAAFVDDLLIGRLRARTVVVGSNFRFGHRAQGDPAALRRLGRRHGMDAVTMTLVDDGDLPISSTRIRAEIAAGRVAEAATLLGRPHAVPVDVDPADRGRIEGRVVDGIALPRAGRYRGLVGPVPGHGRTAVITVGSGGSMAIDVDPPVLLGPTVHVQFVAAMPGTGPAGSSVASRVSAVEPLDSRG